MATVRWVGGVAEAVKQISSFSITAYDAATTYKITIGGVSVSVSGAGSADATAAALVAAAEAKDHPYYTTIDWSSSGSTVTATSAEAGFPFEMTASASGGTGTVSSVTTSQDATGPYHADNAENWDGGSLPAAGDTIIIEDTAHPILFGLDCFSSTTFADVKIKPSFSGWIGLRRTQFTRSADGRTLESNVPEYRDWQFELHAGNDILIGSDDSALRANYLAFSVDASNVRIKNASATRIILSSPSTVGPINVYADSGELALSEYGGSTTTWNIYLSGGTAEIGEYTAGTLTVYVYGGTARIYDGGNIYVYGGDVSLLGDATGSTIRIYDGTFHHENDDTSSDNVYIYAGHYTTAGRTAPTSGVTYNLSQDGDYRITIPRGLGSFADSITMSANSYMRISRG